MNQQCPGESSRINAAITGIPSFPSFHEYRKHILLHMAAVFRSWARHGYTEGISGHISVRDPEFPDLIWMNPIGKHFALMNASDMLCLRISDGAVVGGNRVSLRVPLQPNPWEKKSAVIN